MKEDGRVRDGERVRRESERVRWSRIELRLGERARWNGVTSWVEVAVLPKLLSHSTTCTKVAQNINYKNCKSSVNI